MPLALYQRCLSGPARATFTIFAVGAVVSFALAIARSRRHGGTTDLTVIAVRTSSGIGAASLVILVASGYSLDAFLVCGVGLLCPGLVVPMLAKGARWHHRVTSGLVAVAGLGFLWAGSIAR